MKPLSTHHRYRRLHWLKLLGLRETFHIKRGYVNMDYYQTLTYKSDIEFYIVRTNMIKEHDKYGLTNSL